MPPPWARGKGGGKGGRPAKSVDSFYGNAKTTEEKQAVWDSVYKANVKRGLGNKFHHQMPGDRPGRRRAAPGDPRNAQLNKEHDAYLKKLKDEATREWKAEQKDGAEQQHDESQKRKRKDPPAKNPRQTRRTSLRIAAQEKVDYKV